MNAILNKTSGFRILMTGIDDGRAYGSEGAEGPWAVAIVDDNEDNRLLLQDILEMSGDFRCVAAYPDAGHALAGVPAVKPELVLMDIDLPGVSGIECTRQLKSWFPSQPVVMVSARADEESISASRRAGCSGYLVKPFSVEHCLALLRGAMQRRAA
jgi:two-component system NarL family response regulator